MHADQLNALGIGPINPGRSRAPEPDADNVTYYVAIIYAEIRRRGLTETVITRQHVFDLTARAWSHDRRANAEIDAAMATLALDRRYRLSIATQRAGVWSVVAL